MGKKIISIVTPCYNEKDNIRECCAAIKKLFDEELKDYDFEHIICDNASSDGTIEILREIAEQDKRVKVIINARNFGPMRSHFNGVKNASGNATVLFMPADMQDPPSLIPEFVKLWEQGYEVIYGIRANREETFPMLWIRKFYYRLISGSTYLDMPPDVGDFQLVDNKVLSAIRGFTDSYPFTRAMAFECGFKQIGVPYMLEARKRGISKNRFLHLIDQGLNGLISFSSAPMRLALLVGIILALLSVGYAFFNVIWYFIEGRDAIPRGTTLLITALFFFSGVQLLFMGFMGEYILGIFNQVRRRPLVVERERMNFNSEEKKEETPPD